MPEPRVGDLAKRFELLADCCHDSSYQTPPSQRSYGGNLYHAAPSTATLEININQHNPTSSPSCCSVAPVIVRRAHPPPQEQYANPDYCPFRTQTTPLKASAPPKSPPSNPPPRRASILKRWTSSASAKQTPPLTLRILWTSRRNPVMFRASVVELLLSLIVLAGGCWCTLEIPDHRYCPYYSGVWSGALFVVNSLLGFVTARAAVVNLYVAHLVLSLLAVVGCTTAGFLAVVNWQTMGVGSHSAFCVVGAHDASRISYIFSHLHEYNFRRCLHDFKLGTAVNSVQFAVCLILLVLFTFSAVLCMKRTCTRCR